MRAPLLLVYAVDTLTDDDKQLPQVLAGRHKSWNGDAKAKSSSFYQNEFIVRDEAQVRLRYIVKVKL